MRVYLRENGKQVQTMNVTNPPKVGDNLYGNWLVVGIEVEENLSKGLNGEDLVAEVIIVNVERI